MLKGCNSLIRMNRNAWKRSVFRMRGKKNLPRRLNVPMPRCCGKTRRCSLMSRRIRRLHYSSLQDGLTPSGGIRRRNHASRNSHSGGRACNTRDHNTTKCSTRGCTRNDSTRDHSGTRDPSSCRNNASGRDSTRCPSMPRGAIHSNCSPRKDSSTRGCRGRYSSTPMTAYQ